jgi:hypothetical protein
MPTIGTLSLNIEPLEVCDCYTLSLLDTSHYVTTPENLRLDITVPGFSLMRFEDISPNQVNIFNSYSLGLTNTNTYDTINELPDGIYEVTLAICPHDTLYETKYFLRTCKFEYRLSNFWAKVVSICDTETKIFKEIEKIEILLKGAKANAQICNTKKAVDLYRKADELLQRLEYADSGCNC